MKTYKEGHRGTFKTTDSELNVFNGQSITVIKVYDKPDAEHDEEVLPMYDVKFKDESVLHVFDDEIHENL